MLAGPVLAGLAFLLAFSPAAQAATLDEQIRTLSNQAAAHNQQASNLREHGDTLAGKLASINSRSAAISSQIVLARAKHRKLTSDIEVGKQELVRKKQILDESIRQIYHEAQISPLEMLASSKTFSEYIDKQQYLDRVKDYVTEAAEAVRRQQLELEKQQNAAANLIRNQTELSKALAIQQADADQLLRDTRGQESRYAEMAKVNNEKAEQLRALQASMLAARFGGGTAQGGGACGGGYPARWCNAPRDSLVDSWGMYNRECVSYTAFRVANSGRYMPYWGGRGNAKQWPGNAQAAGIPVDGNPRPGDVAITTDGPYGHAMYVEGVSGGKIRVSQYNYGNQGEYSEMTIPASGLYFIHF